MTQQSIWLSHSGAILGDNPMGPSVQAWIVSALVALSPVRAILDQASSQAPIAAATALVIRYADGRRVASVVTAGGGSAWTAAFPRLGGFDPPPDKLPVTAVKYDYVLVDTSVKVSVSVLRGQPHQTEDAVATVTVAPGQMVVVDELRSVGVMPVTFTIARVGPPDPGAPEVSSPSPLLVAGFTGFATEPSLAYQVSITNRSSKAVRSIDIETIRGGQRATSARRFGKDGQDLIAPGAVYLLNVPAGVSLTASNGVAASRPFDRISVTAVLWSDGSFTGDPIVAMQSLLADHGDRLQVARIIAEFERSTAADLREADLAAALRALPIEVTEDMAAEERQRLQKTADVLAPQQIASELRIAMQAIKTTVLGDLAGYDARPVDSRPPLPTWVATELDRYRRWLACLTVR